MQQHVVIYIMGVSGSGKTTIGQQLSARTGYRFFDADDFHSPANIAKMNAGIPLTDEDRWPWLQAIHNFVTGALAAENIILVCSALKAAYRKKLSAGIEDHCRWVFLNGDYETILRRLQNREGHYMPPSLLQSQFEALEPPADAITIDIAQSPETIVNTILAGIQ